MRIESLAGSDAYVAVAQFGCCGALEATKLFSLENGAPLMEYTGAPAWLEVPNSRGLVRLVGVDTAWSASADPRFGADPSLVAVLSYATRTAALRQVGIRIGGGTVDAVMSVPELAFVAAGAEPDPHFVLWPADGRTNPRAITDVAVRVTFTSEHVAIIPIVADELDLAQATLTGGLTVSLLPPE